MPPLALLEVIAISTIGFGFFFTALWLVARTPRQLGVIGLVLLTVSLGLIMASTDANVRGVTWAFHIKFFSILFAPAIFWHLVYSFPPRSIKLSRNMFFVLPAYSTLLALFLGLGLTGPQHPVFLTIRSLVLLHVLICCLLGIGRLAWLYTVPGLQRFKAQSRIAALIIGLALSPLLFLFILPELLGLTWILWPQVAMIPILAIPITIAVVATKAELFQFDKLVSRSLVHGSVAVFIFLVHGAIAYLLVLNLREVGPLAIAVAVGLLSLTLLPVLDGLRRWVLLRVDRYVYRIG